MPHNMIGYKYLVIRIRRILGYRDYFGPLLSCDKDKASDAQRLFGKPDHDIEIVAWSKSTKYQKEAAKRNPENTC